MPTPLQKGLQRKDAPTKSGIEESEDNKKVYSELEESGTK
jgi:hypothetical protein